jgi:Holliday junction DNA helicase RuvA
MYDFFRGTLIEKNQHYAVLEIGGIGYKLYIPQLHFNRFPPIGETVFLYASWVVREMSQTLYGFFDKQERALFEQLLQISGIGPKTSLALIGHYSPCDLEKIVRNEDTHSLAQVPGIGKKTAEKLLVDLRNRLKLMPVAKAIHPSHAQDALSALQRLGCSQTQAEQAIQKALQELSSDTDLSTLITTALKYQK